MPCDCSLQDRQWNPNTKCCETCGSTFRRVRLTELRWTELHEIMIRRSEEIHAQADEEIENEMEV